MVQIDDERFNPKPPLFKIYGNYHPNQTLAYLNHESNTFSSSMKRSVRHLFSVLLLLLLVTTLSCRFVIHSGFGPVYFYYVNGDGESGLSQEPYEILDFPLFNSTLLKLSEIEAGEQGLKREIERLLEGNVVGQQNQYRGHFMSWFRIWNVDMRLRALKWNAVNLREPQFSTVWPTFRNALSDWATRKRFDPDIMSELVDLMKAPIDRHKGMEGSRRKYPSCAVVGNSGILLNNDNGELIDSHEIVIRLNNARINAFKSHVGSKTNISFINSNILHLCSRTDGCGCHPYGEDVPIVMYICQPVHLLDYAVCNSSHRAPLLVTDLRFDVLAERLIKYYSLKRYADGPNKTLERWTTAHEGSFFHYSSGMQAVMLALGTCDRVSLFGFGKSPSAKHHYHTGQKSELALHDYEAEYDFYQDLVVRPQRDDESLCDAWEHYKECLRLCPHHRLPKWLIVHTFYNGLNNGTRMLVDAAAGGTLMRKTHDEAYELIEDMALNNSQWSYARTFIKRHGGKSQWQVNVRLHLLVTQLVIPHLHLKLKLHEVQSTPQFYKKRT